MADLEHLIGEVIDGRWELTRKLGGGSFGAIYEAEDTTGNEGTVAMKFEGADEPVKVLRIEVVALQSVKGKNILRMLGFGKVSTWNYIVLALLGKSLDKLKRETPQNRFTVSTSVRLIKQCLDGIHQMHECGFLHRDIKPANFALGKSPPNQRTVYVLDFGMARKYISDTTGEHRRPRSKAGFRGTLNYAPLAAHREQDMGRKDDLWSVFYMLVQFITGTLPWRNTTGPENIAKVKEEVTPLQLLKGCPEEMYGMYRHLVSLRYADRPDYEYLQSQLRVIMRKHRINMEDRYDWDNAGSQVRSRQ